MTLRVLVVDDHPLYREGLVTAIATMPGVEVVGSAADGAEAVRESATLGPDVVVMDLHMPGVNGIEATRQLLAQQPDARVIVLTMFEDDDSVFAAMRAGARGYLLKGAEGEDILRAVHSVGNGDAIFGPGPPDASATYRPGAPDRRTARTPQAAQVSIAAASSRHTRSRTPSRSRRRSISV